MANVPVLMVVAPAYVFTRIKLHVAEALLDDASIVQSGAIDKGTLVTFKSMLPYSVTADIKNASTSLVRNHFCRAHDGSGGAS